MALFVDVVEIVLPRGGCIGFLACHAGVYRRDGCLPLRGRFNERRVARGLSLFFGGRPPARIRGAFSCKNGCKGREGCVQRRTRAGADRPHHGFLARKRHHRFLHCKRRFSYHTLPLYFDCFRTFRCAFLCARHMFRRCGHGWRDFYGSCAQRRRERTDCRRRDPIRRILWRPLCAHLFQRESDCGRNLHPDLRQCEIHAPYGAPAAWHLHRCIWRAFRA